jgi:membrane-bound lytic murein transglycosylase D
MPQRSVSAGERTVAATKRWVGAALLSLLCVAGVTHRTIAAVAADAVIPRPSVLERDIQFWIRIYSQVTTNEGLLHDESNLGVVYETVHFPPNATPREREAMLDAAKDRYAALLRRLAVPAMPVTVAAPAPAAAASASEVGVAGPAPTNSASAEERRILDLWGPEASPARLELASRSIRFQLGQADRFRAGLVRSGAWEAHIADTLANLGLPPEIAALPHVESSFNPAAYSKVGAAGLWQFMRSTGRRYLRVDAVVDERLDPFRSTEAAAQLLAYNYRILGSWPLAITAYNHGAAGMRRARDTVGTDDIGAIARNYRGPSFGFASRNFYVSFLAALEIERNPEKYFGPIERVPEQRFREVSVPAYVPIASLERLLKVDRETLRALNPALQTPVWLGQRLVPRGYKLRLPDKATDWTSEKLAARLPASDQYVAQIESRSHRVKRGETLPAIAQQYGLGANALAELNGLAVDGALRPGRSLRLPDRRPALVAGHALAATGDAGGTTPVGDNAMDGGKPTPPSVVVGHGEALKDIAARSHVSQADLIRFNHLRDANFIFEGQKLRTTPDALRIESDAGPVLAAAAASAVPSAPESAPLTEVVKPVSLIASASTSTPLPASMSMPGAMSLTPPTAATAAPPATAADSTAEADSSLAASRGETVSRSQAEALGPSLVPGGAATPQVTDAVDYSVARDDTVRVAAAETVGHYAEWLGVSSARLRTLNHLGSGRSLLVGQKLRLDFSRSRHELFEQRRRDYHARLQSDFFDAHRIEGTEIYVARRGDSLWTVTQRYPRLPPWLLQEYNPDTDFGELRPGSQLVVPKVEEISSAN